YDWNEMMGYVTTAGVQGICPIGWHIPTDAEWCTLTTFLDATVNCNTYGGSGTDAGGQMKEAGFDHWDSPNTGATNSSGFTALGVGYRDGNGNFSLPRNDAIFWSSSEDNLEYGIGRNLSYTSADVVRSNILKSFGFSVRCLADTFEICTPQPDQANAGPDSLNIAGDSIYLYANIPASGSGQWAIISGQGGIIADSSSATSLFTGLPGSTYVLVWTISTPCGSSSDTLVIGFAAQQSSFTCGDTLTDTRDGQQYPTVQIGTQCWMAQNLNVGTMVNSVYTGSVHSEASNNVVIEKYCYNNDPALCAVYGGLYDWNEAMGYVTTPGTHDICPVGWHIPTDAEWCTLTTYLDATVNCNPWGWSGTDAGGQIKETGFDYWESPNTGATNSSGFTALGAGYRYYYGNFLLLRSYACFWTSNEFSSYGVYWNLNSSSVSISRIYDDKTDGFSVRCLRN
ncbi:MAG: hypothetical protein IH599_02420, partial [Bacteroidales bacterium]|nr:hypothetical protein [Bacteroidales bacterium]